MIFGMTHNWGKALPALFLFVCVACSHAEAAESVVYSQLTDGYWQLWRMDTDGGNARQLTTSKSDKRDSVCADNGQKILYRTNNGQLKVLERVSGEEAAILDKYNRISNPAYCEAQQKIAFVRYNPRALDISDIWTVDMSGEDPRVITRDHQLKYQPAFSPDCSQIAFIQPDPQDKSAHQVWIMDFDGTNPRQITTDQALAAGPQFLNSNSLIFASNREGNDYEIYRVRMDGTGMTQLTANERLDNGPEVSAASGRIAFVSNRNGMQQIWIMNADGSDQRVISGSDHEAVDPTWCSEATAE